MYAISDNPIQYGRKDFPLNSINKTKQQSIVPPRADPDKNLNTMNIHNWVEKDDNAPNTALLNSASRTAILLPYLQRNITSG